MIASRSGTKMFATNADCRKIVGVALVACATVPAAVTAQVEMESPTGAAPQTASIAPNLYPRVFLDCQGRAPCDRNHFRTEIEFVNWAQDREDSDVHVIATSEEVGGGGSRIVLDFIGRGAMAHLTDRLTHTTRGSDVFAETRDGFTRILQFGLMRYAIESGLTDSFDLDFGASSPQGSDSQTSTAVQSDPWNSWTFRIGLSGDLDLRETSTNIEVNPSLSAERITEDWKIEIALEANAERSRRDLSGGRVVRDDRDEWEVETLLVRSGSNHLSYGFRFDGGNSISENQNARIEFSPAVEYNYFPYSMSNRRQLIVQYSGGLQYTNYNEETIFNVSSEIRPQHELDVRYSAREAWGNASVGVGYSQYLHDTGLYRADINGSLSFRITRGLDLTLSGSSSWVQDEIHIPLSDISDEDILLGRQNLPSSYRYTGRIGVGYRFGSAFTNVVNTRFGGGGGGGNFDD